MAVAKTYARVVVGAVDCTGPCISVLLQREPAYPRRVSDIEVGRAVSQHEVVYVFDRVLRFEHQSPLDTGEDGRALTASVQKMPHPLPFQYLLCRRCATLCAVLSVAAHWARLSRVSGEAMAEWYVPNAESAVTTDTREATFLRLNNILTGVYSFTTSGEREGSVV